MTSTNYILPPEILLEVFYHATATHGALGLHGILLTCRLWYTLALNESRLWTCISLDTIFVSRFHHHRRLSPDAAKHFAWQCVNRSGRLPIHLFINMDAYRTPDTVHCLSQYAYTRTIMGKVIAMMDIDHFKGSSSRLETLTIHQQSGSWKVGFYYMLHAWRIPLRRLELQNYRLSVAHCWTDHIPSLTSIVLIDPSWMPSYDMTLQCDIAVTQLTLERCTAWSLDDLLILRVYQALTTLRLFSKPLCRNFERGIHPHGDLPVLLPSVNTLSLTGEIPHHVLSALNLPALATIEIRNHGSHHSMGHLRNTTLHYNIRRLDVLMAGREAHWWTCDLTAVLTATSNLRTFVVLSPMLSQLPQTSVPDTADLVVRQN